MTAPIASYDERLRFYRQLLWIAGERGYARGWAAHKFREKYGNWPLVRYVVPMSPDPAVRSWVKSRQIAYASSDAAPRRSP